MQPLSDHDKSRIDIRVIDEPTHGSAGVNLTAKVAVTNGSAVSLATTAPNPFHLSYFWVNQDGKSIEGVRTVLPRAIAPNNTDQIVMSIQPPATPGCYTLRVTAVQEHVCWFFEPPLSAFRDIQISIGERRRESLRVAPAKLFRELIRRKTTERWRRWNRTYKAPSRVHCPICLYSGDVFKAHRAEDAFGGGCLLRFECSECGGIFGTEKMISLSKRQLAREYRELYWTYDEGDTTETELQTFHKLNPTKSGIYLNYGCGKWSKAIQILREEGFNILGYDPTAGRAKATFVISSETQLRNMKFDGLMSHNLLEHLQDPVTTLQFMKSLLNDGGLMVHATPCYRYEYEYSRFHLFFFTGNSVNVMAYRAGLIVRDTEYPNIKIFTSA